MTKIFAVTQKKSRTCLCYSNYSTGWFGVKREKASTYHSCTLMRYFDSVAIFFRPTLIIMSSVQVFFFPTTVWECLSMNPCFYYLLLLSIYIYTISLPIHQCIHHLTHFVPNICTIIFGGFSFIHSMFSYRLVERIRHFHVIIFAWFKIFLRISENSQSANDTLLLRECQCLLTTHLLFCIIVLDVALSVFLWKWLAGE